MISIIILSQISTLVMRENFYILFEKRTKAIVKLENVKYDYEISMKDILDQLEHNKTLFEVAKHKINTTNKNIEKNWLEYKDRISFDYSNFFLSYYISKILTNNDDFYNKEHIPKKNINDIEHKSTLITKSLDNILKTKNLQEIKHTNELINIILKDIRVLVQHDLSLLLHEKQNTRIIFTYAIVFSIIFIFLVFLLSIILSIYIINNFKKLHNSLEQKVEEKTKELTELNDYLRIKISKEVAQNRKKDIIMFQQARLASLGEMLNNIAHQWRQPLSSITMIIQSFQTKMLHNKLSNDFVNQKVKDALLLANNMSQTLEDFKNFFSPNKAKSTFYIKDCIKHSIELSKYSLEKENIKIILKIQENVKLTSYYNELSHVFLNLISNSKDALKDLNKSDKTIKISVNKDEQNAIISVLDNGGGIKEDIIPKIFEPYYTTKYKSAGTGIGLYMTKQIIEKHMSGTIEYEKFICDIPEQNNKHCSLFTIKIPLKEEK
ncbi:MAG: histidine kinase [Proteobacteria bacterium]|nr:MAG: histidine kinase [Pseudomonadota bacterium]